MTNTITHEGVEYRKVDRKAYPGDMIYFVSEGGAHGVGKVISEDFSEDAFFFDTDVECDPCDKFMWVEFGDSYDVLEPIESEEIPVEASPTVIELLANISRRLYEAERQLKSQAYEINELYKAVAERG